LWAPEEAKKNGPSPKLIKACYKKVHPQMPEERARRHPAGGGVYRTRGAHSKAKQAKERSQ